MERGRYGRRLQRERSRPTDEDIQDLIALIKKDERAVKVTVFGPSRSRAAAVGSSFAAVYRWSAGILRHRTAR